jgi:hypothetical protein
MTLVVLLSLFACNVSRADFILKVAESTPGTVNIDYSGGFLLLGAGVGQNATNTTGPRIEKNKFVTHGLGIVQRFDGVYSPSGATKPLFPLLNTTVAGSMTAGSGIVQFSLDSNRFYAVAGTGPGYYSASGRMTLTTTLAALGLNLGDSADYLWTETFAGAQAQKLTIQAVPEPSSVALVGSVIAGLSVLSPRRRQA